MTTDWNQRLHSVSDLQNFIERHQTTIKQQPTKFIILIDTYCTLLQDNNVKVQAAAQQAFKIMLMNANMRSLIETNITMVVTTLNSNLSSRNTQIRETGDLLFSILENSIDANTLL